MPASDLCEPHVIAALQKEGWQVIGHQLSLHLPQNHHLFIDLLIQRGYQAASEQILVLEVKCFSQPDSYLLDFYNATGQYVYYRNALRELGIPHPLYLAIPYHAFEHFFQRTTVQMTLKELKVKIVVVELTSERIIEWLIY
jgi:hypothetical protein